MAKNKKDNKEKKGQEKKNPPAKKKLTERERLLRVALYYASMNLRVIPCYVRDKTPRYSEWRYDATTNTEQLKKWWSKEPFGVGIATGCGIIVLDVDIREEKNIHGDKTLQELEQEYGKLPETWTALTGAGGLHYYFSYDGDDLTSKRPFASGLKYHTYGSQVIAPPSIHPNGERYKWLEKHRPGDIPLAPFPEWLHQFILDAEEMDRIIIPDEITKGRRNTSLFRMAAAMRMKGLTTREILTAVREINQTRCYPPLGDNEIQRVCRSAGKYERGSAYASKDDYKNYDNYEDFERGYVDENGFFTLEPFTAFNFDTLPHFPTDAFPKALREYIEKLAANIQVDVSIIAVPLISILSACVQGKFQVKEENDHAEPLSIYTVTAAKLQAGESEVFEDLLQPIESYEEEKNTSLKIEIDNSEQEIEVLEDEIIETAEDEDIIPEHYKKLLELDEEEKMPPFVAFANDVTTQMLIDTVERQKGKMLVFSSQEDILETVYGLYNDNNKDTNIFFKSWSGESVKIKQSSKESVTIDYPSLSLLIMMQSERLHPIIENSVLADHDLLSRFLYAFPDNPDNMVDNRILETKKISSSLSHGYAAILRNMLDFEDVYNADGKKQLRDIRLSQKAYETAKKTFYHCEQIQKEKDDVFSDWVENLHSQILRIAAVFHCVECAAEGVQPDKREISQATMQNAAAIGDYFYAHGRAAFSLGYEVKTPVEYEAKYILKRLDGYNAEKIWRRDLQQSCRGKIGFKKAEDMTPGLAELVRRGYIKITDKRRRRKKKKSATTQPPHRPLYAITMNPEYIKQRDAKSENF